ncbi:MAG: hypothetical protein WBP45_12280 [Daejeonella sp.]
MKPGLKRVTLIILTAFSFIPYPAYSKDFDKGIIISNYDVAFYTSADVKSEKLKDLTVGEVVSILEVTKEKFPLGAGIGEFDQGINKDFCKQFPFIKVKTNIGQIGWVSGEFVFKLIENHKEYSSILLKTKFIFTFNKNTYRILLGQNYGVGASENGELTVCDEFYPLVLYNPIKNKYHLIKNIKNPNSKERYSNLILDQFVAEEIINVIKSDNKVVFKIKCRYQEGTGAYDTKISFKNNSFYADSYNYKRYYPK